MPKHINIKSNLEMSIGRSSPLKKTCRNRDIVQNKAITQITVNRHGLMLLWFTDLMNVTEEVTIHRPNVSTLLSRGDLNAATRGPFIRSLISCLFSDEVLIGVRK